MATQPFDKATADKLVEAFNNLNSGTRETLSTLETMAGVEQKMVNIAKQLGQVYKTQQDKIDEQLKGKSLQEKLSLKLQNSEKKLDEFAQARINSYMRMGSLQNEIQETTNNLLVAQRKDPTSKTVTELQKLINKKSTELNLEKQLLSNSGSQLTLLKVRNDLLKIGQNLVIAFNKTLEMSVKLSESLMTKLNMPTTIVGTFTKILDIFNEIDTAATNVRQKFGLLPSQGAIFEKNIREASIQLAEFGINAEQLGGTMKQIGSTFTSLQSMEKGLVKDVSIMSAQFGISAETSAKFLQTLGGVSGKSAIAKQKRSKPCKASYNPHETALYASHRRRSTTYWKAERHYAVRTKRG
jgi:hypothetical protein